MTTTVSPRQPGSAPAETHGALSVAAAAVSASALAGAVGLASGALDLGTELEHRLPFHSPVLGGVALALVVGLPFAVLAVLAWRRRSVTPEVALVAGLVLIGWIVVELAFIRTVSFLHPMSLLVAAAFVLAGRPGWAQLRHLH